MLLGTLVVLFNPSEAHVQHLFRHRRLCDNVVAVDNSPQLDVLLQDRIRAEGIDLLSNFNVGSVAGAYNIGIERLIKKKCELLFLFDQDSEAPEDYFLNMSDSCLTLGSRHFLIGPKVFYINVKRYLPVHILNGFRVSAVQITDRNDGLLPCSSIITSGSVLSAETYRTLGPFRADYFIDHVDTEYSFRAASKGVPVYVNTSLALKHEVGRRIDHKLLSLKIIQWNTSPLRQYYSARNCIHVSRLYGTQFPILALINVITIQQLLSVILYETDKRKKIMAMAAGIIDGFRGRYGSFDACQPRRSALCEL
ncbi:MAG: glycosyltransferase family 2 protein [Acidobacteriaceae bacterium]